MATHGLFSVLFLYFLLLLFGKVFTKFLSATKMLNFLYDLESEMKTKWLMEYIYKNLILWRNTQPVISYLPLPPTILLLVQSKKNYVDVIISLFFFLCQLLLHKTLLLVHRKIKNNSILYVHNLVIYALLLLLLHKISKTINPPISVSIIKAMFGILFYSYSTISKKPSF